MAGLLFHTAEWVICEMLRRSRQRTMGTVSYRVSVNCGSTQNFVISKCLQMGGFLRYYPFPSYKCFLMPLQQTVFWKHSDKRRNCSKQAISIFATMFYTFTLLVMVYPFNYRDFLFLAHLCMKCKSDCCDHILSSVRPPCAVNICPC